jgi:hypothetical protein
MPIGTVAAMNASLDANYGPTRAAGLPSSHTLGLFFGDPLVGGVEISGFGYARPTVLATDWLTAAGGFKSTHPIQFAAPTGAWPEAPTHWALFDGDTMWDTAPLVSPLYVTSASSTGPTVVVTM